MNAATREVPTSSSPPKPIVVSVPLGVPDQLDDLETPEPPFPPPPLSDPPTPAHPATSATGSSTATPEVFLMVAPSVGPHRRSSEQWA